MAVQVISFRCVLKDKLGRVISSTINQNVLTHSIEKTGALSALASGLQDLRKGEKRKISLRADQAYGYYDPDLVLVRHREELSVEGDAIRLGEKVIYARENGEASVFRVTELSKDFVTLDGNHPLAGQDLIFEIEAMDARAATEEEIDSSNLRLGPDHNLLN
ncbi:MAG: peptidylprolyl isomerase [Bdellovibrionales bacterium]